MYQKKRLYIKKIRKTDLIILVLVIFSMFSRSADKVVYSSDIRNNPPSNRLCIFYINDVHGKTETMSNLKSASDRFEKKSREEDEDYIKISAGDINIGGGEQNKNKNALALKFLELMKVDAAALGNHEFDRGTESLGKDLDNVKFKYIAANLNTTSACPLAEDIQKNRIVSSTIIHKNNNSYGIIGTIPIDLKDRVKKDGDYEDTFSADDFDKTTKEINEEIKNLKEKGINKIILVSHMGYPIDKKIAQKIDGIDVIVGGHSHDLIKGITDGENLLKSPSGDPVLITQAGQNGQFYGVLDVEFDSDGRIINKNNNVYPAAKEKRSQLFDIYESLYLGRTKTIGTIANSVYPENTEIQENPIASFFNDAIKWKSGADAVIINGLSVRGGMDKGKITNRRLASLDPFKNNILKVELTEPEIVDLLKLGIKSTKEEEKKPGLFQVAGAKYTIGKDGELKELYLEKNGEYRKIDVNAPNPFNTYTVAYNSFMFDGNEGMTMLKKPNSIIENYKWSSSDAVAEYIQTVYKDKPVEIKETERITIEKP